MTIRDLIRAYMLADDAIAAEFGSRFYPVIPQDMECPALVLSKISPGRDDTLRGPSSFARPRYQADIWIDTGIGERDRITTLVRQWLSAQRNVLWTDDTVSPPVTVRVQIDSVSDADGFAADVNDGFDRGLLEFFVGYGTVGGAY